MWLWAISLRAFLDICVSLFSSSTYCISKNALLLVRSRILSHLVFVLCTGTVFWFRWSDHVVVSFVHDSAMRTYVGHPGLLMLSYECEVYTKCKICVGLRRESVVSVQSNSGRRIEKTQGVISLLTIFKVACKCSRLIKTCGEGVWSD